MFALQLPQRLAKSNKSYLEQQEERLQHLLIQIWICRHLFFNDRNSTSLDSAALRHALSKHNGVAGADIVAIGYPRQGAQNVAFMELDLLSYYFVLYLCHFF